MGRARRSIRQAQVRESEVTYEELAKRLKKHGFKDETEASVTNKLKRGTFAGGMVSGACLQRWNWTA